MHKAQSLAILTLNELHTAKELYTESSLQLTLSRKHCRNHLIV